MDTRPPSYIPTSDNITNLIGIERQTPEADEGLVETRAASVNPVDLLFRTGTYGEIPLPPVPGGDGAGVVAAVGREVDSFEVGDRVFASGMDRAEGGTFAEYAAILRQFLPCRRY